MDLFITLETKEACEKFMTEIMEVMIRNDLKKTSQIVGLCTIASELIKKLSDKK